MISSLCRCTSNRFCSLFVCPCTALLRSSHKRMVARRDNSIMEASQSNASCGLFVSSECLFDHSWLSLPRNICLLGKSTISVLHFPARSSYVVPVTKTVRRVLRATYKCTIRATSTKYSNRLIMFINTDLTLQLVLVAFHHGHGIVRLGSRPNS